MIDTFYEETVVDKNPNCQRGKSTFYLVARIVSIVVTIILLLSAFITINQDQSYEYILSTAVLVFMAIVAGFTSVVFKKNRARLYSSFDYTFVSGELTICQIIDLSARKKLITIDCEKLVAMDKLSSNNYQKYANMSAKKIVATPNIKNLEDELYFLYYQNQGKNYLIVFEPSDILRIHLRKSNRLLIINK